MDEITRLLKFNREKVSGGDIDFLSLDALRVATAAGKNLVNPEGETVSVRFAAEEVEVVLTDEERRIFNCILASFNSAQQKGVSFTAGRYDVFSHDLASQVNSAGDGPASAGKVD